jgi:hypothetical protein
MKWRIYYRGGATFDSAQGTPHEAPGDGVVVISYLYPGGRRQMKKWDWYYWHGGEGQWWGSDVHGLLYQLTHDPRGYIQAVKQGAMVSDDEYAAISTQAATDPDFPVAVQGSESDQPIRHR